VSYNTPTSCFPEEERTALFTFAAADFKPPHRVHHVGRTNARAVGPLPPSETKR